MITVSVPRMIMLPREADKVSIMTPSGIFTTTDHCFHFEFNISDMPIVVRVLKRIFGDKYSSTWVTHIKTSC